MVASAVTGGIRAPCAGWYSHGVIETLLVLAFVAGLVITGVAVLWVPWHVLLVSGFASTGLGLAVGVPAGLYYHWKLRCLLSQRGQLPELWWLHPTRYHPGLQRDETQALMLWFRIGAVGFLFCIAGSVLAALALWRVL